MPDDPETFRYPEHPHPSASGPLTLQGWITKVFWNTIVVPGDWIKENVVERFKKDQPW